MSSTSTSASDLHSCETSAVPSGDVLPDAPGRGYVRIVRLDMASVVERAFATSPLRLLTPKNDGHAAWVYTSSFGGGLVDGDRLGLDVAVADGAAGYLSTQASTKVYRSQRGTRMRMHAGVGDGGLLVSVPDPIVCFADSRFDQEQTFDLVGEAGLIAVDWMSTGRRESGEHCSFAHYSSRFVVHLDGRLVMYDALALRREDGDLSTRLGRFAVLATAVIAGRPLVERASTLVAEINRQTVSRRPQTLVVASALEDGPRGTIGVVMRIAGRSVEAVGQALRESLSFVPALLGDDPWARKW